MYKSIHIFASSPAGRLLTLEDDGGRCRATGDDEMMQVMDASGRTRKDDT